VAGEQRLPAWPQLPTFAELGLEALDLTQWYGLFAPAGTPSSVVDRLNTALNQVLADPESVERLLADGVQVQTSSPQQLGHHVQTELAHWQQVLEGLHFGEALDLTV
jgi:tripartite-type tricarboxylate transporter receptor subunit TctC